MAALTRKFLTAMGIEDDKADEIITAHTETVTRLKTELDQAKADADRLPAIQKELDDMKAQAAKDGGKNPYQVKYEAIKEEFEQYKADQAAKESHASKSAAYRAMLKEAGVSDKRLDAVLRVSDVDGIELDKDGGVKGKDKLIESVRAEWADFIVTTETRGAQTASPPANNGATPMTRDEIYKRDESGRFVYDAAQRQQALSQIIANEQKG